jgi:hypothetical protein
MRTPQGPTKQPWRQRQKSQHWLRQQRQRLQRRRQRLQAKAKDAKAKEAQKAEAVGGSKRSTDTTTQQAQAGDFPQDLEDWELSEGSLPEGSTLLGSKALLKEYPEDEANSKKTKKTNIGKGEKSKNKTKE